MPQLRHVLVLGTALILVACKPSSERYAQSVTVDLPPAVPVESINLAEADPGPVAAPAAVAPAVPVRPVPAPARLAGTPQLALASATTGPALPAAAEVEPVTASTEPAATSSSRPALSDALIARTLGRIGFPCGRVVATSPVEDGAWRIDCSSGASYRATDRTGRMRFKRW